MKIERSNIGGLAAAAAAARVTERPATPIGREETRRIISLTALRRVFFIFSWPILEANKPQRDIVLDGQSLLSSSTTTRRSQSSNSSGIKDDFTAV